MITGFLFSDNDFLLGHPGDIISSKHPIREEINRRERQILVHSYLYYVLSENIIEDYEYDKIGKRLAELIRNYPEEHKMSRYYKFFKDFGQDGCYSGYQLPKDLPEIINNAYRLLRYKELNRGIINEWRRNKERLHKLYILRYRNILWSL